jgi:predicted NUDIX family NTP pyrophosphohydrolase
VAGTILEIRWPPPTHRGAAAPASFCTAARAAASRCCSFTPADRSGLAATRAWSIPKGEYSADEDPLDAARREFAEELGSEPPAGQPADLGEVRQKAGKVIRAWALAGDLEANAIHSNTFTLEWPPRSGRMNEFPEVDRAEWFDLARAREKINPAQAAFLDRLAEAASG